MSPKRAATGLVDSASGLLLLPAWLSTCWVCVLSRAPGSLRLFPCRPALPLPLPLPPPLHPCLLLLVWGSVITCTCIANLWCWFDSGVGDESGSEAAGSSSSRQKQTRERRAAGGAAGGVSQWKGGTLMGQNRWTVQFASVQNNTKVRSSVCENTPVNSRVDLQRPGGRGPG